MARLTTTVALPLKLNNNILLTFILSSQWLNFCLDLVSIVTETFRGQTYKSLDSITLSAACKVRKIFTMRTQPSDDTDDDGELTVYPFVI